jgi:polyphosphate kinase
MRKTDPESSQWYINRDLSWLEFNQRVLCMALDEQMPLFERLKFFSIVSTNLDEFFMIRVGGLRQQLLANISVTDISGLNVTELLDSISRRAHTMYEDHWKGLNKALKLCHANDIAIVRAAEWNASQKQFFAKQFLAEVQPLLTPLAVEMLDPFPTLPGLGINLAVLLADAQSDTDKIAIVPVPSSLPRFFDMPADGSIACATIEDIISENVAKLFAGFRVKAVALFRITRDADVSIEDDDDAADLISVVEKTVSERRRRAVVRLELSEGADGHLKDWLMKWCELSEHELYENPGLLDASGLMSIVGRRGFESLRWPDWPGKEPLDLLGSSGDIWETLNDHDMLLFHPYESFEPVVELIKTAAADPAVLAIKQTLYRTSGKSPIITALEEAAMAGKHVTVLVELKARFDEMRNADWARRLEDAGCHVIYGIVGLKTHAKVLLIIRRDAHGIQRYVHLSTGNYNEKTASLYSDIGLITRNPEYGADASALFNLLTGYSQPVNWSRFIVAPMAMKDRLIEYIDREAQTSTAQSRGLIMAKVNSLQDPEICRALYKASQAGVRILLNVRGICCLRPGVKGLSENIRVTSIVDRFLEHARIFYFRNAGSEQVYLSSADWMERNLIRRVEILFPVLSAGHRQRLISILKTFFADNTHAWELAGDGTYSKVVSSSKKKVRAQERFYTDAATAVRNATTTPDQFQPLENRRKTQ